MAACRDQHKLPAAYKGEIRIGDLRDNEYRDRMLNGIDIICHAAGWPSFLNDKSLSKKHYLEPALDLINTALEWRVKRFVNLSNIAVASIKNRHDANSAGSPRRHNAMLNCMMAVENYLKSKASENFSVVNLRCGIYSGKHLNLGVLPALLNRIQSKAIPEIIGQYAYLPLVDGRDIGQAFARASLAPAMAFYESMNIVGPEVPEQKQVYEFLHNEFKLAQPVIKLPAALLYGYSLLTGLMNYHGEKLLPNGLADFLANPFINNQKATELIGYNPEVHWTASLQDSWLHQKTSADAGKLQKPLKQTDIQQ